MASLQQKRPSISNWFSSLRRQPKNKKAADSLFNGDKQYQRSCIDLPSSTFYVQPKTAKDQMITSPGTSTDNLLESERKSRSNMCARCCCPLSPPPKSRSQTPPLSPNTNSSSNDTSNTITPESLTPTTCSPPRSPALNPYTSIASYKTPTTSTVTTPTSVMHEPPSPYDNVIIPSSSPCSAYLQERKNIEIMRVESPSANSAPSTPIYSPSTPSSECGSPTRTLCSTKTEFLRSTTITTTRRILASRPVELIISNKGELIVTKGKALDKTLRSSSLDCVLDDAVEHIIPISTPTSPHNGSTPLILDACASDFKFIDDSSTSQSETERNTQQQKNAATTAPAVEPPPDDDKDNYYYTLPSKFKKSGSGKSHRSMSVSNGLGKSRGVKAGLYLNNNVGSLCDDCRTVIERNRNNRDMHQPSVMLRNKVSEIVFVEKNMKDFLE